MPSSSFYSSNTTPALKGEKGDKGDPGIQGPQGLKGDIGPRGLQGDRGIQGLQGPAGSQGLQGDQGPIGLTGSKGDTGAQGIQGLQGPIGPQGSKGDTGATGLKGDTGSQGPQGLRGDQGLAGPKGDTGSQGIQGPQGLKGDQGIQGLTGPKGDTGSQGLQGPKGDTGSQGPIGPQGLKGDTGSQGPQGTGTTIKGKVLNYASLPASGNTPGDVYLMDSSGTDPQGQAYVAGDGYTYTGGSPAWQYVGPIRGPKGDGGAQGLKGDTGATGAKGDTGAQGIQGVAGPKGDTGSQGIQGNQGPQGIKGDTGAQGIQGIQGPKGDTGSQGPQGPKGDTGPAPDTSTFATRGANVNFRDIVASRGDGTGVIYFDQPAGRFLYWDGSQYQINGAPLYVGGDVTSGTAGSLSGKLDKTGGDVTGGVTFRSQPSIIQSNDFGMATATGGVGALEIKGSAAGGAAFMQFHRPGSYASYLGIDTDNQWKVGGWSAGAVANRLIHERNASIVGPINVREFGAKMDGSQDDIGAYNAARLGVQGKQRIISIPSGLINISAQPSSGVNSVLWLNNSDNAQQFFGGENDIVEGFVAGSKFYGMGSTNHSASPVLRIDQKVTHSFTSTGAGEPVIAAFKINQDIGTQKLDDFPWGLSVTSRSQSYGAGQIVGLASQMIREIGSVEKHPIDPKTGRHFPCSQMWGAYIEIGDETKQDATTAGSLIGIEMGVFANGNANETPGEGKRGGIDIGFGRHNKYGSGPANRMNYAIHVGCADQYQYGPDDGSNRRWRKDENSFIGRMIDIEANWDIAVLDTTRGLALGGAPVLLMSEGHKLAFTADGQNTLRYEAGGYRFVAGGNEVANIASNGTVTTPKLSLSGGTNTELRYDSGAYRFTAGGEVMSISSSGDVSALGKGLFSSLRCTSFPTSPAGLPSGSIWVDQADRNALRVV